MAASRSAGRRASILLLLAGLVLSVLPAVRPFVMAQEPPEAFLIKVEGFISSARAKAVERYIGRAERLGVKTVIIELNTPGGTLDASCKLGDFIFTRDDLNIVAYVNNEAYSGGTIVALACDKIYIDERLGAIGDVEPVGPSGQPAGEKYETVVREKMLNYARARGYPLALAKAMVTKEIEVWRLQMQDDPDGDYQYVEGEDLKDWPPEEAAKIVRKELVEQAGELLTMGSQQAVEFGFARAAVASHEALYKALDIDPANVRELRLSASERLLSLLDPLSPLLIVGGIILMFIELSHPGFGLPGILGIACFVAFFIIKWTQAYAHLLEVVLFGIGVVLLLLEFLVIPGFGVAGIAGIACVFVSLVLALQEFTLPTTPEQTNTFVVNIVTVLGAFTVSGVCLIALAQFLPSLPVLRRITHVDSLAAAHVGDIGEVHTPGLSAMAGQVGVALTPLHPTGRAEFGEKQLDVVTEGGFVPKGARVRILVVQGARVVVEPYQEA